MRKSVRILGPILIRTLSLSGLLLGIGVTSAQEREGGSLDREEVLDIDKFAILRIKILLEDFSSSSGVTVEDTQALYGVVSSDLHYSDYFSITTIPRMNPGDTLGVTQAKALVRGTVELTGGELILNGTLESLPDRGRIFSREYRTRPEWYREAAHRFADDIVLYLTGEQGISRTRIAFTSNRAGSKEIYVVDYDGHGLHQVTRNGSINLSPVWSPDATKLAYVSYKNGDPDIFLVDLTTGEDRLLVGGPGVQSAPAFSPDGKSLAYAQAYGQESEIYLCNADGGENRHLTRMGSINTSPSWSPDGRRVAFTSDRSGNPQLYVVDADGGAPRRLTFVGKWNDEPDWSPKGDRIIYTSRDNGSFRISLVDPSGLGEEDQRTYGEGRHANPVWAPDGRHVVYSAARRGRSGLNILEVDSGKIRPVVLDLGEISEADWSSVPAR